MTTTSKQGFKCCASILLYSHFPLRTYIISLLTFCSFSQAPSTLDLCIHTLLSHFRLCRCLVIVQPIRSIYRFVYFCNSLVTSFSLVNEGCRHTHHKAILCTW